MSVNMMQTISIVAFVLAGIFTVVALILWFSLNVRGIIDDLSGKKAERQIRELREQNVQTQMADRKGRVEYSSSSEKLTGKLRTGKKNETTGRLTEPLAKKKMASVNEQETALLQEENATTLLDMEEGTTVLEAEEGTTILEEEGTTVLGVDVEGTTVLAQDVLMLQNGYKMVLNEVVVHTEERIL